MALPNGLRVLVSERSAAPLVTIDLWVRAGSREETRDEGGAAHFLEHLLFKGTRTRGPGDSDIAIENLGATLNAATGPDFAHFYTTVASAHFAKALDVLADVVRNASLPDSEVDRERRVILDELSQRDADPAFVLLNRLYRDALPASPYAHPPGGDPAQIRLRGRDTLASFYRRRYTPARCVLVVVGDVASATVLSSATGAFGTWRPDGTKAVAEADAPEQPFHTGAFQETAETSRPILGIAFHAPAARDQSAACAAQILTVLLGDSESGGRFAVPALAGAGARALYTPRLDGSLLVLTASLPPPKSGRATAGEDRSELPALQAGLLGALASLQTNPPSPAELQAAKEQLNGRDLFDWETNAGLAYALGYSALTDGLSPEMHRACLQQISVADVVRFAGALARQSMTLALRPRSDPGTLAP